LSKPPTTKAAHCGDLGGDRGTEPTSKSMEALLLPPTVSQHDCGKQCMIDNDYRQANRTAAEQSCQHPASGKTLSAHAKASAQRTS
jgi:hypothetical protein